MMQVLCPETHFYINMYTGHTVFLNKVASSHHHQHPPHSTRSTVWGCTCRETATPKIYVDGAATTVKLLL